MAETIEVNSHSKTKPIILALLCVLLLAGIVLYVQRRPSHSELPKMPAISRQPVTDKLGSAAPNASAPATKPSDTPAAAFPKPIGPKTEHVTPDTSKLVNTGPGDTALLFVMVTIAGAALSYARQLRHAEV